MLESSFELTSTFASLYTCFQVHPIFANSGVAHIFSVLRTYNGTAFGSKTVIVAVGPHTDILHLLHVELSVAKNFGAFRSHGRGDGPHLPSLRRRHFHPRPCCLTPRRKPTFTRTGWDRGVERDGLEFNALDDNSKWAAIKIGVDVIVL